MCFFRCLCRFLIWFFIPRDQHGARRKTKNIGKALRRAQTAAIHVASWGFSAEFQSCYPLLSHRIPDVVNKLNILDESPTPFYGLHKNLEDYCFRFFFGVFVLFSSLPLWFLWLLWVCGFCGFTMFWPIYLSIYLSTYCIYLSIYLSNLT